MPALGRILSYSATAVASLYDTRKPTSVGNRQFVYSLQFKLPYLPKQTQSNDLQLSGRPHFSTNDAHRLRVLAISL